MMGEVAGPHFASFSFEERLTLAGKVRSLLQEFGIAMAACNVVPLVGGVGNGGLLRWRAPHFASFSFEEPGSRWLAKVYITTLQVDCGRYAVQLPCHGCNYRATGGKVRARLRNVQWKVL